MKRPLWAVALLALTLRAGLSVVTEFKPIFPAYYYTDSTLMDQAGWRVAEAWREGRPPAWPGSPSQRVKAAALAGLYRLFGHRLIVPKLLSACIGAAIPVVFYVVAAPAFGPAAALASAALIALWPSHVFFTSQIFKDGPIILLCLLAFWQALALMSSPTRPWARAAALTASLLALSLLRPYYFFMTAGALGCGLLAALARLRPAKSAVLGLSAALLALGLFKPLSQALFLGPLALSGGQGDPTVHLDLVQPYNPGLGHASFAMTPAGLSAVRRGRTPTGAGRARRALARSARSSSTAWNSRAGSTCCSSCPKASSTSYSCPCRCSTR